MPGPGQNGGTQRTVVYSADVNPGCVEVRLDKTPLSPARVLLPLGLGTALSLMGDATLYTVLPTHAADAGIALQSVGVMLGANRAIRLLTNGPAGLAYDRWPRRYLFVAALFVGAISTAIYAATRGFWPLLVGRLLWGLAWSGIWVGGATMILDVATGQDRGRWTGLYQTWFFVGAALGSFGGGLLTDHVGYTNALWIGAGLTAVGALVALILLPETRGLRPCVAAPVKRERRKLRANLDLWTVASLHGMNRFVLSGLFGATLALLVQDRLGTYLSLGVATLAGILSAGRTVLSMVSAPLTGTISDRPGGRWQLAVWGTIVAALSMFLISWENPAAIWIGVALGAIAGGSIQALVTALIGDIVAQDLRGRAIGLVHTAGDLGSAVGPLAAYAVLQRIGLSGIYLFGAGLFVLQCGLIVGFRSRERQRLASIEQA
jgi:MFS family permease